MHKSAGFTLIELLITISIVAVLTSLAAPSFRNMITASRVSSAVNTFMSDMRFARSEAVRRGGKVVMCRSDAPEAPTPACGAGPGPGGFGWISGWIIFEDRDSSQTYTTGDNLLRVQSAITSPDAIADSGSSTKFSFVALGRLSGLAGVVTMTFGSSIASTLKRVVCIDLTGRARIAGDGSTTCGADS